MKKIFSMIGAISLVCFSFYYTDLATQIIRNNDPIMKSIISNASQYEKKSIDAVLKENYIVPGESGVQIDIEKSYAAMKKYGSFSENLMVFSEVEPSISIHDVYDKYVSYGNRNLNYVSLIFICEDTSYLESIVGLLNSKGVQADFFLQETILEESSDVILLLNKAGHSIQLYSKDYTASNFAKYQRQVEMLSKKKLKFCVSEKENDELLAQCSMQKKHTIIPEVVTANFPFSDVKQNLKNGSIVSFRNNQHTFRELKYILNYIRQKGYQVVNLERLLEE